MAHFALVKDGIVNHVMSIHNSAITDEQGNENPQIAIDSFPPGQWIQCSYNSRIRGCYPSVGWLYDAAQDVFIAPETEQSVQGFNYFLEIYDKWQEQKRQQESATQSDVPTENSIQEQANDQADAESLTPPQPDA